MDTAAAHRRTIFAALATIVVLALAAAGCSSSSDDSKSSSTSSSTTANATSDLSTPPSCPSASEVDASLQAGLDKPSDQQNGSIRTCTYKTTAGGDDVVIRFETGVSAADFDAAEQSPGPSGETATPVAGLGDAAYSTKSAEPGSEVVTVAALSGTTEVSVQAPVEVSQVEALTRKLLDQI